MSEYFDSRREIVDWGASSFAFATGVFSLSRAPFVCYNEKRAVKHLNRVHYLNIFTLGGDSKRLVNVLINGL